VTVAIRWGLIAYKAKKKTKQGKNLNKKISRIKTEKNNNKKRSKSTWINPLNL
jgi:hypothetical protein